MRKQPGTVPHRTQDGDGRRQDHGDGDDHDLADAQCRAHARLRSFLARAFLIVTPGITIRDRLQVLYPEHPESYYRSRELLPNDMLGDIGKAAIVITNYHAVQHGETLALSRVGRAFLTGNAPERQDIGGGQGGCKSV